MRIVILGAPGVGKRTQSALLAEKLALATVTTGELLKRAIAEENQWGLEAKALQDAGRVVTEDIVLGLVRDHLLEPALADGFILDGFPRNLLQALTLDELLVEIGQPLDLVVLLDIDNDNLMERLVGRRTCRSCSQLYNAYRNPPVVDGVCDTCGGRLHQRSDDNEETVSNRIHVFDHLTAPLITHYEKGHRLVRVDGNGSLETVFQRLLDAVEASAAAVQQTGTKRKPLQGEVTRSKRGKKVKRSSAVVESQPAHGKKASAAMSSEADSARLAGKKTATPTKKGAKVAKKANTAGKTIVKKAKAAASVTKPALKTSKKTKPAKQQGKATKKTAKATAKKSKPAASRKKAAQLKKKIAKKKLLGAKRNQGKKVAGKKHRVKQQAKKGILTATKKAVAKKPAGPKKKRVTKKAKLAQVRKKVGKKSAKKKPTPKKRAAKKVVSKRKSA